MEVTRAGAQASEATIEQGDLQIGFSTGTAGAAIPFLARKQVMPTGTCWNGTEFSASTNGSTQTDEVKYFYNRDCTQLARDVISVTTSGPSVSSRDIQRTVKTYNLTGQLLATQAAHYTLQTGSNTFSTTVFDTLTIGTSSQPSSEYGTEWNVTQQSSMVDAIAGSDGQVDNDASISLNESLGNVGVLSNATWTTDSSGNVTLSEQLDRTFYKGALGGLSLMQGSPFTISGGSTLGTSQVQSTIVYDASGALTSVQMNGTLLGGNTLTVTSSGSPLSVNGTIADPSGKTLATYQADRYGNGTITYAGSGAQGEIVSWHFV